MKKLLLLLGLTVFTFSCKKEFIEENNTQSVPDITYPLYLRTAVYKDIETFESGTKTTYTNATVRLATGEWYFQDALIGTLSNDKKEDLKSIRIQNTGSVTMQFDYIKGASLISLKHAKYGSDASSVWNIQYSTNNGSSWNILKSFTSTNRTLTYEEFPLDIYGNIRLKIQKISGSGKLNIDNISLEENNPTPSKDYHLTFGNPSNAITNQSSSNNYLMEKNEYCLSYNNSKGSVNWVAWHLSSAWKGKALRKEYFNVDATLPAGYFKATQNNYNNTGFDKGHMCPSEDRDLDSISNRATFLMTNMVPQAPKNNQIVWKALEKYCQDMAMTKKYELFIYAGNFGSGGTGSNSAEMVYNIANAKINVPGYLWKVIVLVPTGSNDLKRVNASTRVIAVIMPNAQTSSTQPWANYRVSVDQIERIAGYDLLSNLPENIQTILEQKVDNGPTIAESVSNISMN